MDRDVATEVIERLQPLGIEATLAAQAARSRANEDKRGQVELALEQVRYEVGRARRQYDAVDPDNRLVAAELEKRWNDRLSVVRNLETELEGLTASPAADLTRAADDARRRPGACLVKCRRGPRNAQADHANADRGDRRPRRGQRARSGDPLAARRPLRSQRQKESLRPAPLERNGRDSRFLRVLARQMTDKAIASVLNRSGKTTGRGNGWAKSQVCSLRTHNDMAAHREGERHDRGEVTLDEAAAALSFSPSTVRRLIKDDPLAASQPCKGAPWIIKAADLGAPDVKRAATARRLRRPPSGTPLQTELEL